MLGVRSVLLRREPGRRTRRVLVIAGFAGVALWAIFALWLQGTELSPVWSLVVAIFALLPLWPIQEFRRKIVLRGEPDERERQRRDDAYRVSYLVVQYGFLAFVLILQFFFVGELVEPFPVVWAAFLHLLMLPSAVFAWREPDTVD